MSIHVGGDAAVCYIPTYTKTHSGVTVHLDNIGTQQGGEGWSLDYLAIGY